MKEEQYLDDADIQSLKAQLEEQDFKASGDDYEHFITSSVWEDMKDMLEERITGLLTKLESMESGPQMDIIYKARLHELRQLVIYPEHVIELFKVIKEVPDESNGLAV